MKRLIAMDMDDYFDSLDSNDKEQELSVGEYVDEIIDGNINDCGFDIPKKFFKTKAGKEYINDGEDIDVSSFINQAIQYMKKDSSSIIKDFIAIFDDMNSDDIDAKTMKKTKKAMEGYLNRNFDVIARRILEERYNDAKSIYTFIKENVNIKTSKTEELRQELIKKVRKAYDDVARWLKADAPDLELAEIRDEDIQIDTTKGSDYGYSDRWMEDGVPRAYIKIYKSTFNRGEQVLMNTIYHELVHCVVGQADDANTRYKNGEFRRTDENGETVDDDKAFQNAAHNDDIWDRCSKIITQHSGYAIQQYGMEAESNTEALNDKHVGTILCYNCGWFHVCKTFDGDMKNAINGTYKCQNCGRTEDINVIYAGDNPSYERNAIDDAVANANDKAKYKVINSGLKRLQAFIVLGTNVTNRNGDSYDFDDFLHKVDGELATELGERIAPYNEQEFFDAYCEEYYKKYNERFEYDIEPEENNETAL